ncbi:MAG TPA: hypothetical protein VFR33_00845 [Candidatus Dormibacteraeota bacterium]|nr:hypothetical protein [Candidatus Dormibacteraeota bacterium]
MGRFLVALLAVGFVACQNETHAVFSPLPSPTPHTAPTAAILQSADVPAGLSVCVGSGPIDVYLSVLAITNPTLAANASGQWQALRALGAKAGAISVFTSDPSACKAEFAATTKVKAMSSFVAVFDDEGAADRAWQAGLFGFVPPPAGEVSPGLTRGASTGLGVSSFVYDRPSVRLASWRRSVFVALVVVSNLDVGTFHAATGAVDPRLN